MSYDLQSADDDVVASNNIYNRENTTLHPLSTKQERNLLEFIDNKFLEITRAYKKRSDPSTTLPTLVLYLSAAHPLLSVILQIPPVNSQAALRSSLLLRLTGDVLTSITGYEPTVNALPILLSWLDELDRGWLAVLQSQIWNPDTRCGVDVDISANDTQTILMSPISQTDRTRLRSIIVSGINALEEWLENIVTDEAEDLPSALERLGATQEFDDLFHRTLSEMGELEGNSENLQLEL